MLRSMRTKKGREPVVCFLRVLKKLSISSDEVIDLAILLVVFSEGYTKKNK